MRTKTILFCAIASLGLAAASVPAYAGTPGFCPQVDNAYHSFFWWLSHHLPQVAMNTLFGDGGVCATH